MDNDQEINKHLDALSKGLMRMSRNKKSALSVHETLDLVDELEINVKELKELIN
tara:strand:- start:1021 stop:1182 length:162 start_codon:yes stop_codon:yes gene_type:complete